MAFRVAQDIDGDAEYIHAQRPLAIPRRAIVIQLFPNSE
jgi:hypothetical protein